MSAYYECAENGAQELFSDGVFHSYRRTYAKGVVLVNEGDESDSFYMIESGKVRVFGSDEEGNEITYNVKGPGSYFGEMAALDGVARSASVETTEKSQICVVPKSEFQRVLSEHPSLLLELAKCMARRMRALTGSVKNLALMDVCGRVARTLLEFAEEQNDQLVVEGLSHRDIASMVGAPREVVNRIMQELAAVGCIRREGKRLIISESLSQAC